MAISPTVLVDSSPVSAPTSGKLPIVPLLIAIIAGALIAILATGGVMYYLARSGKLPLQVKATAKEEQVTPVSAHALVLEPMLVNLADSGGSSYLRVALTLRVADAPEKKNAKPKDEKGSDSSEVVAEMRDTTLEVLGQQTAEALLASDGKERLKAELKSALAAHNHDLKVMDVFFTDFLVQR